MRIEASPVSGTPGVHGVSHLASTGPSAVSSPPVHPSAALRAPTILVFDSGLGGLSVFRELARARPDARFVYAADDAGFPYGARSEEDLVARVVGVMDALIARLAPDAVVIACNTASTLVLPVLRARYSIPFVGTVPAIKPACEGSLTKQVSVLATPGTVKRDYTQALIRDFAGACRVTLVGSTRLAGLAEAVMAGEAVADEEFAAEIAPAFVREGKREVPHRYGGAGLHALSAGARPPAEGGALAGALGRSGPGHRPPAELAHRSRRLRRQPGAAAPVLDRPAARRRSDRAHRRPPRPGGRARADDRTGLSPRIFRLACAAIPAQHARTAGEDM